MLGRGKQHCSELGKNMCPEARRGWGQRENLGPSLGRVPAREQGEMGAGGGCRGDSGDPERLQGVESLEPPREKRDEICLLGADAFQVQVGRLRPGRAECFTPSSRDGNLGDGRGDKGWDRDGAGDGDGDGLGVKILMNLKQAGLVMGCLGARLGWGWIGWGQAWMPNC